MRRHGHEESRGSLPLVIGCLPARRCGVLRVYSREVFGLTYLTTAVRTAGLWQEYLRYHGNCNTGSLLHALNYFSFPDTVIRA